MFGIILYIIAFLLFLISAAGFVFMKLRLKPNDSDIDDYYWEFEETDPEYARYTKWSKSLYTIAVIAAFLLFLAVMF